MKRVFLSVLMLIVGLIAGFTLQPSSTSSPSPITPGDELQSVDPDYVQLLSFTNKAYTMTAQRSVKGARFDVVLTFTDGRASRHCTSTDDIFQRLAPFTRITAKQSLSVSDREGQFPIHVGNLLIQTFSVEPDGPIMVFTNKTGSSVAFISEHYVAEVAVPLAVFRDLAIPCSSQI